MADEFHQLGVQVETADGDQIDDANCDSLAEQCGALGDKGLARLRSILVRWADEFDGRDQLALPLQVEDADFVLVFVGRVGLDCHHRGRGSPGGGGRAAVAVGSPATGRLVRFEGAHVDFHQRAEMDARLGNVPGWELSAQLLDNARRPHAVETLPRSSLADRGAKMIAQGHGNLLHRNCITSTVPPPYSLRMRRPAETAPLYCPSTSLSANAL